MRSHFAPLPDSDLMQRQIGTDRIILIASPGYLEERGTPSTAEALSEHDGLIIAPSARAWRLASQDGKLVEVAPRPRFFADESVVLLKTAMAGLGIACLPESIAAPAIKEGALSIVLPSWTAGNITTTILTPHRRSQLPSIRAVIDFLAENRASR